MTVPIECARGDGVGGDYRPFWEVNEPDFVSGEGIKWWLDKQTSEYAAEKDGGGVALRDVYAFMVQHKDGEYERVLVRDGAVIYAGKGLESVACHIDMMKMAKAYGVNEK